MPKKIEKNQKGKGHIGIIISLKTLGTAIVEVERETTHPLYKKVLKRSRRYKVDTNSKELSVGDKVQIIETRPISKDKHFRVERKIS